MPNYMENGTNVGANGTNGTANGSNGTTHKYFNLKDMPHLVKPLDRRQKVASDILQVIGNTPLVKLNKIPQEEGIQCEMYAKCEYLNPGGSVKDRIAYRMLHDAELKGVLVPGKSVIIEPTSGNTGIGLALAAAVKGYRCIIVLPEKMSDEKVNTLRALGAEIIRTPTEAASASPESNINVAARLAKEIPGGIVLDQYNNPCNPLAHYDGTAEEMLWSLDDNIDMVVIGAGTSGSISGVGHKIKERCPACTVVGVDPYGSILAYPEDINSSDVTYYEVSKATSGSISGVGHKIKERCPACTVVGVDPYGSILAYPEDINSSDVTYYEVEGLGYDFLPSVLDRSVVDYWVKTNDADSLKMSRRLIKEEGLLAGGSAGSAMWAACKAAKSLKPGQKCVVLLPDSIRNYMTKFISDQWMEARQFKPVQTNPKLWWWDNKVNESIVQPTPSISINSSPSEAFAKLQHSKAPLLTIEDDNGCIVGLFTADNARQRLANLAGSAEEPLGKFAVKKYYSVDLAATPAPTLGRVSRLLDIAPYVLVLNNESSTQRALGVITSDDLLMYIAKEKHQVKNGD